MELGIIGLGKMGFNMAERLRLAGHKVVGFDFSKDYEVINELGLTLFERSKMERGPANQARQREFLRRAAEQFERTLSLDSENLTAHYNLSQIYAQLDDEARAAEHRRLHERYLPDYNARDRAISLARRANPAADHAAQATVIYSLQRPGAYGLSGPSANAPLKVARRPLE